MIHEESAEANRKGAAADVAYLKLTAAPDYYPMYLIHNYQFLAYSAAMEGRGAETVKALRDARAAVPDSMLLAMPGLDWSIGYLYDGMARFGRWDELLAEPAPNPKLAHAMANHMLTVAAQLKLTDLNYAVLTEEAMAALPADKKTMYPYADMSSFQKQCRFYPMAPLTANDKYASWPEWLAAWQEVLAA